MWMGTKRTKLPGLEVGAANRAAAEEGAPNVDTSEEAIAQTIMGMTKITKKDLAKMSHISSDTELKQVVILKTIADYYNIPILQTFVENFLELKISLGREGRREVRSMIVSQINQAKDAGSSFFNKMRGMLGG